jgi:hypothetical protein
MQSRQHVAEMPSLLPICRLISEIPQTRNAWYSRCCCLIFLVGTARDNLERTVRLAKSGDIGMYRFFRPGRVSGEIQFSLARRRRARSIIGLSTAATSLLVSRVLPVRRRNRPYCARRGSISGSYPGSYGSGQPRDGSYCSRGTQRSKAICIARCPLSGVTRKTYAQSEFFRF